MLAAALVARAQGHDDAITSLLLALVILLPVAKLAGTVTEKPGQPAAMGEPLAVLILGNLELVGVTGVAFLKTDAGLEISRSWALSSYSLGSASMPAWRIS